MSEPWLWHTDEGRLLREVRRASRHWGRVPQIAGYDELTELRRGGQGVVYRARQRSTNRTVAIKVLREAAPASETGRLRFEREIELAARLRHPNIVRVYDSGVTEDGRLCYVMEYVDGAPVDDPKLAHAGDIQRTLALFAQICDAVQHAHRRGVIHRDLKPGNILVDEEGSPQILDFGIARIASEGVGGPTEAGTVSRTGQFLGSLAWASPEQIEADPDRIDTRTDIYSLGVILYELLTGELPHPVSQNLHLTVEEIMTAPPPRPRSLRRDIPDDVEAITLRCLDKEPERRYESAAALERDIRHYLAGEPIEAKRTLAWRRLQRAARRYRYAAVAAILALGVLVTFGATMSVLYRRTTEAESLARTRLIEARRQSDRAAAVTDFLRGTLISVDPARAGGREITVREMLDRAAARIGADLAQEPLVRARVSSMLGWIYLDYGLHEKAHDVLVDAVTAYESGLPPVEDEDAGAIEDRLGFAEVLSALAAVDYQAQRIDLAEQRYEMALALWREAGHEGETESIAAMIHLGLLKSVLGEIDAAESLYLRAHELALASEGGKPIQVAHALFRLGDLHFEQGENEKAESFFLRALSRQEAGLPPTEVVILECQRSYASLLIATGRFDEAAQIATEALETTVSRYGRLNMRTAAWLAVLGDARTANGETEEAERLYLDALDIARRTLGAQHRYVAFMLMRYGRLLYRDGRIDEAEQPFLEAADILEADGLGDRFVVLVRGYLGCCLVHHGRHAEAEPALRRAVADLPGLLGEDAPELADFAACLEEIETSRGGGSTAPSNADDGSRR